MYKVVKVIGIAMFIVAAVLVAIGNIGMMVRDGAWLSPFNAINGAITLIFLAPGLLIWTWGKRLEERNKTRKRK